MNLDNYDGRDTATIQVLWALAWGQSMRPFSPHFQSYWLINIIVFKRRFPQPCSGPLHLFPRTIGPLMMYLEKLLNHVLCKQLCKRSKSQSLQSTLVNFNFRNFNLFPHYHSTTNLSIKCSIDSIQFNSQIDLRSFHCSKDRDSELSPLLNRLFW